MLKQSALVKLDPFKQILLLVVMGYKRNLFPLAYDGDFV